MLKLYMKLTTYITHASCIISLDLGLRMIMNKYGREIRCCTQLAIGEKAHRH